VHSTAAAAAAAAVTAAAATAAEAEQRFNELLSSAAFSTCKPSAAAASLPAQVKRPSCSPGRGSKLEPSLLASLCRH
jgi:hypothetical protein